jgi:hypothetical protein
MLRRQIGLLALVVLFGHAGTVAVAALAVGYSAGLAGTADGAAKKDDCCPAGSHADGMCPMRTRTAGAAHASGDLDEVRCRLVCANQDSALLILLSGAASLPLPPSGARFSAPPSPPPRD